MKLAFTGFEPRYRQGTDVPATTRSQDATADTRRVRRAELLTNRADARLFHAWRP